MTAAIRSPSKPGTRDSLLADLIVSLVLGFAVQGVEAEGARPPTASIERTATGVQLRLQGLTLKEAAERVRAASGIEVQVPEGLAEDKVTADASGHDWSAALRQLLADYSTLETWKGPDELGAVRVLGRRSKGQASGAEPLPSPAPPPPSSAIQMGVSVPATPPTASGPGVWPPPEGLPPAPSVWPPPEGLPPPPPAELPPQMR